MRSIKNSAHAHNALFGFGFRALLERMVDEFKNGKSEIILKLPHLLFVPYHRIFNFSGTPGLMYIIKAKEKGRTLTSKYNLELVERGLCMKRK